MLSPSFRKHRFCTFVRPIGIGFAAKTVNSTAGAVANREVFEMWVGGWIDDLVFVVSVEDMLPPFCEEIRSAQDTEPRLSCLHIGPRRSMCNCQPWP